MAAGRALAVGAGDLDARRSAAADRPSARQRRAHAVEAQLDAQRARRARARASSVGVARRRGHGRPRRQRPRGRRAAGSELRQRVAHLAARRRSCR